MSVEDRSARIAALKAELKELEGSTGEYTKPIEVTVCMPVGPGKMYWTWTAIRSLETGAQSEPLYLHVCAHQHTNAAKAALKAQQASWRQEWKIEDYRYCGEPANLGQRLPNICEARKFLAKTVETPYLIWLDADVRMPPGGVKYLLDGIKARENCGFLGIPYTKDVDHVQNGCTIMPTDLAKRLQWLPERCSCMSAIKEMQGMGYTVDHLDGIFAEHMSEARFS